MSKQEQFVQLGRSLRMEVPQCLWGGSTSIPMYKTNLRRPKDGNRADPWLPKYFLDVLRLASLGGEIPHESLC